MGRNRAAQRNACLVGRVIKVLPLSCGNVVERLVDDDEIRARPAPRDVHALPPHPRRVDVEGREGHPGLRRHAVEQLLLPRLEEHAARRGELDERRRRALRPPGGADPCPDPPPLRAANTPHLGVAHRACRSPNRRRRAPSALIATMSAATDRARSFMIAPF